MMVPDPALHHSRAVTLSYHFFCANRKLNHISDAESTLAPARGVILGPGSDSEDDKIMEHRHGRVVRTYFGRNKGQALLEPSAKEEVQQSQAKLAGNGSDRNDQEAALRSSKCSDQQFNQLQLVDINHQFCPLLYTSVDGTEAHFGFVADSLENRRSCKIHFIGVREVQLSDGKKLVGWCNVPGCSQRGQHRALELFEGRHFPQRSWPEFEVVDAAALCQYAAQLVKAWGGASGMRSFLKTVWHSQQVRQRSQQQQQQRWQDDMLVVEGDSLRFL